MEQREHTVVDVSEKNSVRMHAVGDIDELNAAIGVVQDEELALQSQVHTV